jgi:hypothetical protein
MRERDMLREQKMYFRWLGPYKVKKAVALKEAYVLKELNDEKLGGTVAENRLKRFYLRSEVQSDFIILINGYGKLSIRISSDTGS